MRSRNHFRILQKKRYEARRFHNPYFQHQSKRPWKVIILAVAAMLAVGSLVAFAFGSPYLGIQNVNISGTESISSEEIVARVWSDLNRSRWLFFKSSNRFLYDEKRLRETLSAAYAFESLEIGRACEWRGDGCTLSVVVKEKTSQLLWISDDHVYLADLQGIIIRELSATEVEAWNAPEPLKRLPAFVDVNAAPVAVGGTVLRPDEVSNLFRFQEGLKTMGIGFERTNIDRLAGKWMAVQTTNGYDILIDALGDVELQLSNLRALLRDTVKDPSALQYVDLRFGDHVYYK